MAGWNKDDGPAYDPGTQAGVTILRYLVIAAGFAAMFYGVMAGSLTALLIGLVLIAAASVTKG